MSEIYRAASVGFRAPQAAARPAVAAILWRPAVGRAAREGVEVFLVQRAASLAFLGSHWTFPGGRIEARDGQGAGAEVAAAVRELGEEVDLHLDAAALELGDAGRWITPAFLPIRFDTRYYLVRAPAAASPDVRRGDGELVAGEWVSPARALERWRACDWLIPSPVRRALEALAPGIDGAAERCRAQAELENQSVRLWEVAPGLAVCPVRTPTLPPATHTNCCIIGTDELLVIDPASPYADEQAELERALDARLAAGARVVALALTHHHGDHVGGAAALAERLGAPIWAHAATAERLRFPVDRALEDGALIELGGDPPRRVRAVFTPGHAPGHLCFLEEETGFLVAGDMVAGVGTIVIEPSEGNMAQYLASLARMKALAPRRILPAHGSIIADPAARLDGYIQHRLWREQKVVEALERRGPSRPADLVALVYDDVPAAIHPLAERSLIAHLVKLGEDGRAERAGDEWALAAVL